MKDREIYLDYQSTTPCDPRVIAAMVECLTDCYGNPSSQHRAGSLARSRIANSAEQIAEMLGALPDELIFTSGATEANNLALLGLWSDTRDKRRKIVTTPIDNPCSSQRNCSNDSLCSRRPCDIRPPVIDCNVFARKAYTPKCKSHADG